MDVWHRQYKPLVGFTIVGFRTEEDEESPDSPWLIFEGKKKEEKYDLVISQDPEGNGGGFVFVEDAKDID